MYKIIKVSGYNNPYTLTLKGEEIERRNIEALLCGSIQEIPGMLEDTVLVVIREARKQRLKVKNGKFCGIEAQQADRIVKTLIVGDKL